MNPIMASAGWPVTVQAGAVGVLILGLSGRQRSGWVCPTSLAASPSTPVITVANGNSVIAMQTSANGLRYYWNAAKPFRGNAAWSGTIRGGYRAEGGSDGN